MQVAYSLTEMNCLWYFLLLSPPLPLPPPFHTSFFLSLFETRSVWPWLIWNLQFVPGSPPIPGPWASTQILEFQVLAVITRSWGWPVWLARLGLVHMFWLQGTGEQISAILFLHFQDGVLSYKMKDSLSTQGSSLNAGYPPHPVPQYQVSDSIFWVKTNPSLWMSLLQLESCLCCFSPF